jgi:hypothetical protein
MSLMRPGKMTDERPGPAGEFEGEIREIIRRDVAPMRRVAAESGGEGGSGPGPGNLNSIIQRVSTTSITEIEKLIFELQTLRDFLQHEGQRVQREIAGYAQLSQAAMSSTRVIAESLAQWKGAAESKRTIENPGT